MLKNVMAVVVVAASFVSAQEAASVSQHFKPGDALHYYVSFEDKGKLTGVSMLFQIAGQPKPNQTGFQTSFPVSEVKEFSPGVVEVNGTVPMNSASGSYQLAWVDVTVPPGLSKRYSYPTDFKENITLDIVNNASVNFPKIKSITPNPPK
jgi:hypothetical protein